MTTLTLPREKALEAPPPQVTGLEDVAETIRDDALALAQDRLPFLQRSVDLNSLLRRSDFFDNFKYGLASGVANALAAHDGRVQAVYIYDPSANPDSECGEDLPMDVTVHLLALVTTPTAALDAFIAALDRALTASLRELPSPKLAGRESVLDVSLITERDVRLGLGLAGMLSAVFAPPIKIWQHES